MFVATRADTRVRPYVRRSVATRADTRVRTDAGEQGTPGS